MSLIDALPDPATYDLTGTGHWPSAFAVSELATASIAAVGVELADYMQAAGLVTQAPAVTVDQRLAALWFGYSFRPEGWEMPSLWDPIAGNYPSADGWIRLHTNLPRHRAAALSVLGCAAKPEAVRAAVATWQGDDLEQAIVTKGGAAAAMRSRDQWLAHPQGQAVASEPLVQWGQPRAIAPRALPRATASRPLAGLKVLDLTRVLAGPIATRTLAGFGADVLRIDPPGWDEPGVIPDISMGKRMAMLDLKTAQDRSRSEALLSRADVLVHGYRPGALAALGYGQEIRDRIAPNRVEVTLNAYGWTGPWAARRGFDSLVQMSAGIADTGRSWAAADKPVPLPVQALDHATGYLMAAAVISALNAATRQDNAPQARLSLARTAELMASLQGSNSGPQITAAETGDYAAAIEQSGWGPGLRLKPPLSLADTRMHWPRPAGKTGSSPAQWTA
ncbi:CoA transferase [Phaeobacter sp. QD34_3]|uniref:CoA transferase n=1 Tax=unclassified Phaeobacter TaxID=2621772 RepID=UPI00237F9290|nr:MULTISPECIES: CoA transferase [unclassified Phaeobacter]MDE4133105.1 CoA transferase [Phaeobacter sp. QD34_3]MDE4136825.1 CoA transferase [Phaeobacter sp. QD34_24]